MHSHAQRCDNHPRASAQQPLGTASSPDSLVRIGRTACLMVLLGAAHGSLVQAQTPATAPPAAELTPAERAKRDADKVFQMIMIHSDKPRKVRAEAKAEPKRDDKAAPAVTPTAQRPAHAEPAAAAVAGAAARANERSGKPESATAAQSTSATAAAASPNASPGGSGPGTATQLASAPLAAATPAAAAEEDDDDVALVAVKQFAPEFPGNVMRQLRKGTVQVRFDVQPDGSVGHAEIVKTTNRRLNETAVAAVSQWRFQPVRKLQTAIVELGFDLD